MLAGPGRRPKADCPSGAGYHLGMVPAAMPSASSGVLSRPRMALRWGKRPHLATTTWWDSAYFLLNCREGASRPAGGGTQPATAVDGWGVRVRGRPLCSSQPWHSVHGCKASCPATASTASATGPAPPAPGAPLLS